MLDINLIRNHPDIVKKDLEKRNQKGKKKIVDDLLKKDSEWLNLKREADKLRHQRNKLSLEINKLQKKKGNIKPGIKQAKETAKKIEITEKKMEKLKKERDEILLQLPNVLHKSVKKGKSEKDNKVLRKWGTKPKFRFKIKNHVEIMEGLGIGDFDSSAKVSGNGFYYLKNELALLNQALIRFGIDFMLSKKYEYIETPLMLRKNTLFASMTKEEIENSVYSIDGEDLGLIGTSEQSILAMHTKDTLKELPKKYFSYSMCFRKEIGAHGINEKGLWRTHQFNKIEQFIFCEPKDSNKYYEELLKNSEQIFKKLKVPYQVLEMCSGDTAPWKSKTSDIEVWRPTTKEYEEVGSLSNCTDYQARKLNIKFLDKDGKRKVLHTLNNTAIATSRVMVTILENYQQKDGSVKIPTVLQKYMAGIKKISIKNKKKK